MLTHQSLPGSCSLVAVPGILSSAAPSFAAVPTAVAAARGCAGSRGSRSCPWTRRGRRTRRWCPGAGEGVAEGAAAGGGRLAVVVVGSVAVEAVSFAETNGHVGFFFTVNRISHLLVLHVLLRLRRGLQRRRGRHLRGLRLSDRRILFQIVVAFLREERSSVHAK